MSHPSNASERAKDTSSERAIRRVLFVRALEESNDGEAPSRAAERFLESEAARSDADFERIICERAVIAQQDLERRWKTDVTRFFDSDRRRSAVVTVGISAFVFLLGLFSNVLDRGPVNVILNSFMLLLLWHVFVYVLMAVRSVLGNRVGKLLSDVGPGPVESALSWILDGFEGLLQKFASRRNVEAWSRLLAAQPRFRVHLTKYFGRIIRLRLMGRLNTFAIFSTLGVVAGMYLTGLVQDYRFSWYSTFISEPETVKAFLQIVFAPVLFVFQQTLPALAGQGVQVPGADWIHLFAQAALLYVVVPRSIIAILALVRARNDAKQRSLDLNERYFADLLRPYRGKDLAVIPISFSYSPDEKRMNRLRGYLKRTFGEQAELMKSRVLTWDESFEVDSAERSYIAVALLFNGTQTPEHEVHGTLASQAVAWLQKTNGAGKLAMLVDTSDLEPDRCKERLTLWETVLLRAGIEVFSPIALATGKVEATRIRIMGEGE